MFFFFHRFLRGALTFDSLTGLISLDSCHRFTGGLNSFRFHVLFTLFFLACGFELGFKIPNRKLLLRKLLVSARNDVEIMLDKCSSTNNGTLQGDQCVSHSVNCKTITTITCILRFLEKEHYRE